MLSGWPGGALLEGLPEEEVISVGGSSLNACRGLRDGSEAGTGSLVQGQSRSGSRTKVKAETQNLSSSRWLLALIHLMSSSLTKQSIGELSSE